MHYIKKNYRGINSTIKESIEKLFTIGKIESVSDWQGTKDFEGQKMRVLRNVILENLWPTGSKETLMVSTNCDMPWAEDHFQERIAGHPTNPGDTYKYWPYHTNLDSDEKYKKEIFSHTYQERFWPKYVGDIGDRVHNNEYPNHGIRFEYGDLNNIISLLKSNKLTRQAYLPIWFPEDTWAANNNQRVPCTIGYYFWVENNELHCNYTIRSCDIYRHFRNDVYFTGRLLQYVAREVGILPGVFNMFIFNLHIFTNDEYAFNKRENKFQISL